MLRLIVMAVFCAAVNATAETSLPIQCQSLFDGEGTFAFEPDLIVDSEWRSVRWKGASVKISDQQAVILKAILEAEDIASYESIYAAIYNAGYDIQGSGSGLHLQIFRLRSKFQEVDPTFDRIRVQRNLGMMWHRANVEKIQIGDLAVGKTVHAAWFKDEYVRLPKAEHEVLLPFVRCGPGGVHKDTLVALGVNGKSIPVLIPYLNTRFRHIAGMNIIVSAKQQLGTGFFRLNPELLGEEPTLLQ